LRVVN